jgi:hypothetical protein
MRAVKGSLGHSPKEKYSESEGPRLGQWHASTCRGVGGRECRARWKIHQAPSSPIPEGMTSTLGGASVTLLDVRSRNLLAPSLAGWVMNWKGLIFIRISSWSLHYRFMSVTGLRIYCRSKMLQSMGPETALEELNAPLRRQSDRVVFMEGRIS